MSSHELITVTPAMKTALAEVEEILERFDESDAYEIRQAVARGDFRLSIYDDCDD